MIFWTIPPHSGTEFTKRSISYDIVENETFPNEADFAKTNGYNNPDIIAELIKDILIEYEHSVVLISDSPTLRQKVSKFVSDFIISLVLIGEINISMNFQQLEIESRVKLIYIVSMDNQNHSEAKILSYIRDSGGRNNILYFFSTMKYNYLYNKQFSNHYGLIFVVPIGKSYRIYENCLYCERRKKSINGDQYLN